MNIITSNLDVPYHEHESSMNIITSNLDAPYHEHKPTHEHNHE